MKVSTVRFTVAGVRYIVGAAVWGARGMDAAAADVLRAGAARQEAWADLCPFASALMHRPVAPVELNAVLQLLGQRGRIALAREPALDLTPSAPTAAAAAQPRAARGASARVVATPTTLRVVNDAGHSFAGQKVAVVSGDGRSVGLRLTGGPLLVDRDGQIMQWHLDLAR